MLQVTNTQLLSERYQLTRVWAPVDDPIEISIDAKKSAQTGEKQTEDLSLINIYDFQQISLENELIFYSFAVGSKGVIQNAVINLDVNIDLSQYSEQNIVITPIWYNAGTIKNVTIFGNINITQAGSQNTITIYNGSYYKSGSTNGCYWNVNINGVSSSQYNTQNVGGFAYNSAKPDNQQSIKETNIIIPDTQTNEFNKVHLIKSYVEKTSNAFYKYYQIADVKWTEIYSMIQPLQQIYYGSQNKFQLYSKPSSNYALLYLSEERAMAIYDQQLYLCSQGQYMILTDLSNIHCVDSSSGCGGSLYLYQSVCVSISSKNGNDGINKAFSKIWFGYCPYYTKLSVVQSCNQASGTNKYYYDMQNNKVSYSSNCQNGQLLQSYECVNYCGRNYQLSSGKCNQRTTAINSTYSMTKFSNSKTFIMGQYQTLEPEKSGMYLSSSIYQPCSNNVYNNTICQNSTNFQSSEYFYYDETNSSKLHWYSCYNNKYSAIDLSKFQYNSKQFNASMLEQSSTYKTYQCKEDNCENQFKYTFGGYCLNCSTFEAGEYIQNKQCVEKCDTDLFAEVDTNVCEEQCASGEFYEVWKNDSTNHCLLKCDRPLYTVNYTTISSTNLRCIDSCSNLELDTYKSFNYTCVINCPDGYLIVINKTCQSSCENGQYVKHPGNDQCVSSCSESKYNYPYNNVTTSYGNISQCLVCSTDQYINNTNTDKYCTDCNQPKIIHSNYECNSTLCKEEPNYKFTNIVNSKYHCVQQCSKYVNLQSDQYICQDSCSEGYDEQTVFEKQIKMCTTCQYFKVKQTDGSYLCQDECPDDKPFVATTQSNECINPCSQLYYQIKLVRTKNANVCASGCLLQQQLTLNSKLNHALCSSCNDNQYIAYYNGKTQICVNKSECNYLYHDSTNNLDMCSGSTDANRNTTNCMYYLQSSTNISLYNCNNDCIKTYYLDGNECVATCVPKFVVSNTSHTCTSSCNENYYVENLVYNGKTTKEYVCYDNCTLTIPSDSLGAKYFDTSISSTIYRCDKYCKDISSEFINRENKVCQKSCTYQNRTTTLSNTQYICEKQNSTYCPKQAAISTSTYQCYKQCPEDKPYDTDNICSDKCYKQKQFILSGTSKICSTNCGGKKYYENTDQGFLCLDDCPLPHAISKETVESAQLCYYCKTDEAVNAYQKDDSQTCMNKSECYYRETDEPITENGKYVICYGTTKDNRNTTGCDEYTKVENTQYYECGACPKYQFKVTKECTTSCTNQSYFVENNNSKLCVQNCTQFFQNNTNGEPTCIDSCTSPKVNEKISYSSIYYQCQDSCSKEKPYMIATTRECVASCNNSYFYSQDNKQCVENCRNKVPYTYQVSNDKKQCLSNCSYYYAINSSATNLNDHYQCVGNCQLVPEAQLNNGSRFCVSDCNYSSSYKYVQDYDCVTECTNNRRVWYSDNKTCINCDNRLHIVQSKINKCVYCDQQTPKYVQGSNEYQCVDTCEDNTYKFKSYLCSSSNCSQYLGKEISSSNLTDYIYQYQQQCLNECTQFIVNSTKICLEVCPNGYKEEQGLRYCVDCKTETNGIYKVVDDQYELCYNCQGDNEYVEQNLQCVTTPCKKFYKIINGAKYCVDSCDKFIVTIGKLDQCNDTCSHNGYTVNSSNNGNYCNQDCSSDLPYIDKTQNSSIDDVGKCSQQCPTDAPFVEGPNQYVCTNSCTYFIWFEDSSRLECIEKCQLPNATKPQNNSQLCYECSEGQFVTNISSTRKQECVDKCIYFSDTICYGDGKEEDRNIEKCKMFQQFNNTAFECLGKCQQGQIAQEEKCVYYCEESHPYFNPDENECRQDCIQNDVYKYYVNYTQSYNGQEYDRYKCQSQCQEDKDFSSFYNITSESQTTKYCTTKCPEQFYYWYRQSNETSGECKNQLCQYINMTISDRKICENGSYGDQNKFCNKIMNIQYQGSQIKQCLSKCLDNYYEYENVCYENCTGEFKFHDREAKVCREKCTSEKYQVIDNKYYCVSKCDNLYGIDEPVITDQTRCVDSCQEMTNNKIQQGKVCQDKCDPGFYLMNNVCQSSCDKSNNMYIDYETEETCIECKENQQYIFTITEQNSCIKCKLGQILALRQVQGNLKLQCTDNCISGEYNFIDYKDDKENIRFCSVIDCQTFINDDYDYLNFDDYEIQYQTQLQVKQCLTNCSYFLENNICKDTCEPPYYYINKETGIKDCTNCLEVTEGVYQEEDIMNQCINCIEEDRQMFGQQNGLKVCNTTQCKDSEYKYINESTIIVDGSSYDTRECLQNCTIFTNWIKYCSQECIEQKYLVDENGQHVCVTECEKYASENPQYIYHDAKLCVNECDETYKFLEDGICKSQCQETDYYLENGTIMMCQKDGCPDDWYTFEDENNKKQCSSICPDQKPYPDQNRECQSTCALMKETYETVIVDLATGETKEVVIRSCIDECDAYMYQTEINNVLTYICTDSCPNGEKFADKKIIEGISKNDTDYQYVCAATCQEKYYQYVQHDKNEQLYVQVCTRCNDTVTDPSGSQGDIQQCTGDCSSIRPDLQFYIITSNGTKICVTQCGSQYSHITSDGKCTNKCEDEKYEIISSGTVICSNDCQFYIKSYDPKVYKPEDCRDEECEVFQCVKVCDGKISGNRCIPISGRDWDWSGGGGNGC